MWQATLDRDVGDRTHRLIAACVSDPDVVLDTHLARTLGEYPVTGARAASVRMRLASAAGTYLRRFAPVEAALIEVEFPVGAGVADLVWQHNADVVIDEIKTGSVTRDDEDVVAQVTRFLVGGKALWGERFLGVRVVPLARPARAFFAVASNGEQLRTDVLPPWLEVR